MFKFLKGLLGFASEDPEDPEELLEAQQRGHHHAMSYLSTGDDPMAAKVFGTKLDFLRSQADGAFNTNAREEAFDRGVRMACDQWERNTGAKA